MIEVAVEVAEDVDVDVLEAVLVVDVEVVTTGAGGIGGRAGLLTHVPLVTVS